MEKEFVPYEQSLELKKLGFDDKTFKSYDTSVVLVDGKYLLDNWYDVSTVDEVKAPLYQQAFRWFREKYNIIPNIHSIYTDETHTKIMFWFWFGNYEDDSDEEVFYGNYEETELECLKKLIEIVKNDVEF